MRITTPFIVAAMLAAAPAAAQNTGATADDTNVAAPDTTMTNDAGNVALPVDANGVAVAPETAPVATETADTGYAEPAPAPKKGGFPWGVLGLLGLAGLIPRKSAR